MSSTIFYRFKSQRNTSRILFDGTGLTVFDLKREIIQENKLGDGTDFQLKVYNPDTEEEYDDDAFVIPRSTSVIVKRSPAIKSFSVHSRLKGNVGAAALGNATRYVTGRPRVLQKRQHTATTTANVSGVTEEERIASMFATQENQWEQTQEEMSTATPVFFKSQTNKNSAQENEGPPPPGYMCYRCGGRDHWIKNCPTNSDPNFEGKRIRRTTGIPKKFLKSIEIDPETMTPEEMAQRKIMITDEGKFVVQVEDKQSWEDYQRKRENRQIDGDETVWRKGHFNNLPDNLKCPLTEGLLRQPVKTSKCCNKDFSKEALEDALVDSDFVCPNCGTSDILLDSLVLDEDKQKEVETFLKKQQEVRGNSKDGNQPEAKKIKLLDTASTIGLSSNTNPSTSVNNGSAPVPPVPLPFGMPPFPMFPMPFMPPAPNVTNSHQTDASPKK
ncbi:hypothetical protein SMKI_11G1510 [Saccharomyces mikatae IFO 1815]|uniref:Mpe1p n=1 Tax=Saccharomyces mikatae IFO 1815 TaxID=226126 RepID=A0AA35IPW1_SACMI|nr:uncharacterized protein SMKI_11G1510 [Saccharomyces mikatae IFO 1815]CAI4034702.1 hypothetical protein SMKI_11G1510 [Saccharomyces mikatae IFO 1815]